MQNDRSNRGAVILVALAVGVPLALLFAVGIAVAIVAATAD
jgi:hypothetical protein